MIIETLAARLTILAWIGNLLLLSAPFQQKAFKSTSVDEPVIAQIMHGEPIVFTVTKLSE